ncbi:hypothetical protein [Kribbella sp. NPDC055071]
MVLQAPGSCGQVCFTVCVGPIHRAPVGSLAVRSGSDEAKPRPSSEDSGPAGARIIASSHCFVGQLIDDFS